MAGEDVKTVSRILVRRQAPLYPSCQSLEPPAAETEYDRHIELLDRLLNDPDLPLEPARIWSLLAEIRDARSIKAPDEASDRPNSD
jgi:hypothetical protein